MTVKDLIIQPDICNRAKLNDLFDHHIVNAITLIQLSLRDKPDKLIWTLTFCGIFSATFAYLAENSSWFKEVAGIQKSYWNKLWSSKAILPWHKLLWW